MTNEAVLEVTMDVNLKNQAEELYKKMGTSFPEAVRIFARQSVEENAMPFVIHVVPETQHRVIGIADGEYKIPDDIDTCNDEIAAMFGVDE